MTRQPSTREPRTAAGRELLRWQSHGPGGYNPVNEEYWSKRIVAIEAEAAASAGLDVDVLRQCPSLMAILNRLGKFNEAWWDRLAAEYARLRQGTDE